MLKNTQDICVQPRSKYSYSLKGISNSHSDSKDKINNFQLLILNENNAKSSLICCDLNLIGLMSKDIHIQGRPGEHQQPRLRKQLCVWLLVCPLLYCSVGTTMLLLCIILQHNQAVRILYFLYICTNQGKLSQQADGQQVCWLQNADHNYTL